jgi:hypothetical protein
MEAGENVICLGAAVSVMVIILPNRDLAAIIQAQKLQQS